MKSDRELMQQATALSLEIVEAFLADENDGGFDISAGCFGPNFTELICRWAKAEWNAELSKRLAQPEQEPVAWLRVIDEAMVTHHLGVADPADDYETAKRKMNNLLCTAQDIGTFFAKTEPVQEPAADGLPLVVAGAIFDFAGYLTTRESVIDVGATANASPVADLVKAWANLRGLPLNDAAVLSWQEWLHTAPPQRKPLTEPEPFAWANLNELTEQFNSVNCGTAYRLPGDGLSPLYTSPPKSKPLTEEGPVAYVTGFSKGYAVVEPVDRSLLMCVGMALYRSPSK